MTIFQFDLSRRATLRNLGLMGAVGALSGTAFLAGCGDKAENGVKLNALLDRIVTDILRRAPEFATSLNATEAMAGGPYAGRVTDRSLAGTAEDNRLVAEWIKELEKFNPKDLNPMEANSRNVALSAARYAAAGASIGYGDSGNGPPQPYSISQLTGVYVGMSDFMDSQHNVANQADADAWLSRMSGFAKQITDETARVRADADKGVIPPDFIITVALTQMHALADVPNNEMVLVKSLRKKATTANLDASGLEAKAIEIAEKELKPAINGMIALFDELKTKAKSDAGVGHLPKGPELYTAALAYWTTTNKAPDEVHELGQKLVAELKTQMDADLKSIGLADGSVAERMKALGERPESLYPNTDAGKEQLLADLNKQIADLQPHLPAMFGTLPKAPVQVKRVPKETEAGAPGGYYQSPAPDGSRPGAYYINLRDTKEWPKWSLPTLTYHEAEPGHHFQISIAQEAEGLHYLRSKILWFGAYGEGWALYSEMLADEMKLYEHDVPGRLGYLQSQAFRAARLVVDTGLHAKGWTRQQAIDFMVEATGNDVPSVSTEVDRYCVWPGQACSYMVGKVAIMEAREKAKAELGDKFDIRQFHDTVLKSGAMPLDVLANVVDEWIKAQKAA